MKFLRQIFEPYADRRIIILGALGFSSGLPLLLTASTLSLWLAEVGVSKASIGLFSLIAFPYTIKFLWAPIFDHTRMPVVTRMLGRRRGYIALLQVLVAVGLIGLGKTDPSTNPFFTALFALIVSFLSASLDIVIDAYRVEILEEKSQGAGAAAAVFGYRVGMLMAGAGALYIASSFSWETSYITMAAMMLGCLTFTLVANDAQARSKSVVKSVFKEAILGSLRAFSRRERWPYILLLIVIYKLNDAIFTSMSNVFFVEAGFSKNEIASVVKIFGLIATLSGGFIAGSMVARLGIMRTMMVSGVVHVLFNLIFVVQAYVGYHMPLLMVSIAVENLTAGMTMIALVAYVSSLCNIKSTAMDYALLSSLFAISRTILSAGSGFVAEALGWPLFFAFTSLIGLPALFLTKWLLKYERAVD